MTERCPDGFDQSLISGFLDHELTQAKEQRVRIHLEDCEICGGLFNQLDEQREVTMDTQFAQPTDDQWDERPKGMVSHGARSLGWLLAIVWLAVTGSYGLWEAWHAPQSLIERLLIFGGLSAFFLLFLSVLLDRLRSAGSDRYREVNK